MRKGGNEGGKLAGSDILPEKPPFLYYPLYILILCTFPSREKRVVNPVIRTSGSFTGFSARLVEPSVRILQ